MAAVSCGGMRGERRKAKGNEEKTRREKRERKQRVGRLLERRRLCRSGKNYIKDES
jgi:hypothetical protein